MRRSTIARSVPEAFGPGGRVRVARRLTESAALGLEYFVGATILNLVLDPTTQWTPSDQTKTATGWSGLASSHSWADRPLWRQLVGGSENIEIGAKLDSADKRFSTRFAIFRSTKKNERNTDPDTAATRLLLATDDALAGELPEGDAFAFAFGDAEFLHRGTDFANYFQQQLVEAERSVQSSADRHDRRQVPVAGCARAGRDGAALEPGRAAFQRLHGTVDRAAFTRINARSGVSGTSASEG